MFSPAQQEESPSDMIFILAGRQERIVRKLNEKIEWLDRRITELENHRRF
jgi:hypothetical protein